jgi:hypothetical protein
VASGIGVVVLRVGRSWDGFSTPARLVTSRFHCTSLTNHTGSSPVLLPSGISTASRGHLVVDTTIGPESKHTLVGSGLTGGLHAPFCFSAEPGGGVPPPSGVGGAPTCPDLVPPGCRIRCSVPSYVPLYAALCRDMPVVRAQVIDLPRGRHLFPSSGSRVQTPVSRSR